MKVAMSQQESMAVLGTYAKAIAEAERLKVQLEAEQAKTRSLEADIRVVKRDLEDEKYYRKNAETNYNTADGQLRVLRAQQELMASQLKLTGADVPLFSAKMKQEFAVHLPELCRHFVKGEKILAIKLIRSLTGCGLKEAKDTYEGNYYPTLNQRLAVHSPNGPQPTLGDLIKDKLASQAGSSVADENKFPSYEETPYNPYSRHR